MSTRDDDPAQLSAVTERLTQFLTDSVFDEKVERVLVASCQTTEDMRQRIRNKMVDEIWALQQTVLQKNAALVQVEKRNVQLLHKIATDKASHCSKQDGRAMTVYSSRIDQYPLPTGYGSAVSNHSRDVRPHRSEAPNLRELQRTIETQKEENAALRNHALRVHHNFRAQAAALLNHYKCGTCAAGWADTFYT